jgi:hypothetical protein
MNRRAELSCDNDPTAGLMNQAETGGSWKDAQCNDGFMDRIPSERPPGSRRRFYGGDWSRSFKQPPPHLSTGFVACEMGMSFRLDQHGNLRLDPGEARVRDLRLERLLLRPTATWEVPAWLSSLSEPVFWVKARTGGEVERWCLIGEGWVRSDGIALVFRRPLKIRRFITAQVVLWLNGWPHQRPEEQGGWPPGHPGNFRPGESTARYLERRRQEVRTWPRAEQYAAFMTARFGRPR